ncbi:MAG: SAM-dependent DNA methyltransferase, partial [Deltaproteobacteria bacterium]
FEAHLAEGASIGEDPTAFLRHALGFHLLDPAMGCGLFLQWAKEAMSARLIEVLETRGDGWPAASVAEGVAATALYGVDIQAEAVAAARRFLSSCEARHLRHANALLGIFRESGLPDRETWGAIDALLEAYASDLEHVPIFAAEREAFERRLRELSRRMRPLRNRLDAVLPRSLSHPKPLHWEVTFPEVFARRGGFDVVLGNPPFVRILRQERKEKRFLGRLFSFAEGNFDLYVCFVELAWRLVRPGGRIGLILPDGVLTQRYARRLRRTLLSSGTIEVIEEVTGGEHFDGASVHPLLLVVRKSAPLSNHRIRIRRQGAGEESGGEIELAQAEIGGGEETVIRIVPPPLLHFLR